MCPPAFGIIGPHTGNKMGRASFQLQKIVGVDNIDRILLQAVGAINRQVISFSKYKKRLQAPV
jgi:hypothetical protein